MEATTLNSESKIKILLVEDDTVLSKVLAEELDDSGFETFRAFDGEEGLQLAGEKQPNLILLDVLMPKKNGFDVLDALKKNAKTKNIPVFMLTMLGSDDDVKRGLLLGATDYIVKSQHALPEIMEKVKTYFTNK